VSASLELRAAPAWLAKFRAGLAGDAKGGGGRVASSSVESEDLTRSIVDSEATLRAKRTLRDKLEALLQRPGSGVKDLLATEQELARVQGEIDAAQSELAVMRGRVDMSKLTLNYESVGGADPDSFAYPLTHAIGDFLPNLMIAFGALLTFLAFALPFGLALGTPLVLWLRARKRAADRRKAAA
jgi:hypothetical protein